MNQDLKAAFQAARWPELEQTATNPLVWLLVPAGIAAMFALMRAAAWLIVSL